MLLFVVAITIAIAFAVLVMVSNAESIVLFVINHPKLCIPAKIKISFIHSLTL